MPHDAQDEGNKQLLLQYLCTKKKSTKTLFGGGSQLFVSFQSVAGGPGS